MRRDEHSVGIRICHPIIDNQLWMCSPKPNMHIGVRNRTALTIYNLIYYLGVCPLQIGIDK